MNIYFEIRMRARFFSCLPRNRAPLPTSTARVCECIIGEGQLYDARCALPRRRCQSARSDHDGGREDDCDVDALLLINNRVL